MSRNFAVCSFGRKRTCGEDEYSCSFGKMTRGDSAAVTQDGHEQCPACARDDSWNYLYRVNGCDIWQCSGCGLGRSRSAGFDPARYYGREYFTGGHADGYADYADTAELLQRDFSRLAANLAQHFPPGSRLLEIGCAYGYFLMEAARHFAVHGLEISEAAVAECKRNGLGDVRCGTLKTAASFAHGFDVIVLLDVIEHLENPGEDLAQMAALLNPGGMIVLTTGDFSALLARAMGRRWRLMTPPQHQWFFTPASLSRLALRSDLEVQSCEHPGKTVPVSLIFHQLKRMTGLGLPAWPRALGRVGVPVNLFDAMRVVLRKCSGTAGVSVQPMRAGR